MPELAILIVAAIVASAISGAIGMGGGVTLLAVMATIMEPAAVVPVHGVVQMTSNFTRALRLLRRVNWSIFAMYMPGMFLGAWIGLQLYRGAGMPWFKPAIGLFVLTFLAWDRFKPKRLQMPRWVFVPAGVGGGFLTITIGAAGPFLAAFFLRDDVERHEIVATKAAIQTLGHLVKIPAFLSIGFDYVAELRTIVPLLVCVVVGTFLGTSLLHRMREDVFRNVFRIVLGLLALRLVSSPWL
jgi:uncharacterized membrane protein YfcA